MTERRRWGRHERWTRARRDGERPPWWPDGEPWPPQGPEAWRQVRRRFMGRMARFALLALTILVLLAALVVWAVSQLLGTSVATTVAGVIVLILLLVVARGLVRGLRRRQPGRGR